MKSEKSSGKENILSSLSSLFVYTNVCGIPTYHEPRNYSCKNRILGYFWGFLSFICLSLNCCFQIFNFFQNVVLCFCDQYYIYTLKIVPTRLFSYSSYYFTLSFVAGIPLIFVFQFYFSGKFQKILNSFQENEEKISPSKSFYRKCRIRYLALIFISFMVLWIII